MKNLKVNIRLDIEGFYFWMGLPGSVLELSGLQGTLEPYYVKHSDITSQT